MGSVGTSMAVIVGGTPTGSALLKNQCLDAHSCTSFNTLTR